MWAGSYGLDEAGFVYYDAGAGELRRVDEAGGGWEGVISAPDTEVALVQNGSRVVRLRSGAAQSAVDLAFAAERLALSADGARMVGSDAGHCAGWSADGRQLFQYPIAGVRALAVLPGSGGFCRLGETLFRVDDAGQREDYGPVAGTKLASTADGTLVVIFDPEGMLVRLLDLATRAWQSWELPLVARQLLPLRDDRTFVVNGDAGEAILTLELRGPGARWAQVPMAIGGQK